PEQDGVVGQPDDAFARPFGRRGRQGRRLCFVTGRRDHRRFEPGRGRGGERRGIGLEDHRRRGLDACAGRRLVGRGELRRFVGRQPFLKRRLSFGGRRGNGRFGAGRAGAI